MVIILPANEEQLDLNEYTSNGHRKLPLNKLREVFNQNGLYYSDEEILKMRDLLYRMAEISVSQWDRIQEKEDQTLKNPSDNTV